MLRWEEAVHVALTIVLNRPKPPAVRLRGKNLGTTFSAQLALVTARPPLKNPRMALGYRIFRAEQSGVLPFSHGHTTHTHHILY